MPSLFLYAIATISIILGFIALLKQKTYIDSATNQPTEIELPKMGKLKTNYPALVFVFLGFVAAMFAFYYSRTEEKVEWTITGSVLPSVNKTVDWTTSDFSLKPADVDYDIEPDGNFKITIDLPKGVEFEDMVDWFSFAHPSGVVGVLPKDELDSLSKGKPSLLRKAGKRLRIYKPFPFDNFR